MTDLIAQGPERKERWRRRLLPDQTIRLGRADDTWAVPWDSRISRYHARLVWRGRALEVEAEPGSTNPIFFRGNASQQFTIRPGEHFVIGSTFFTLVDEAANVTVDVARPVTQQTFSPEYLRQTAFRHARQQIEALSRLPEIVAGASTDQELYVRLVNLLLTGISTAEAVAVVRAESTGSGEPTIEVLHWDRAQVTRKEFQPSGRLIREAFQQHQSVLHIWKGNGDTTGTLRQEFDWAFCTPVPGVSCQGWSIYVTGNAAESDQAPLRIEDFQDALKFVELIATTVGSVCDVRLLQRRSTSLSQFFSPPVRDALAASDPEEVLAPRETHVSVLFCDLRGFSRTSEQAADDLLGLLHRVSESLGIMTRQILDHGGVIGDFHGDSAMGFWGWPLAQDDSVTRACQAAIEIRAAFASAAARDRHALAGFRVGMGLATGRAVAGKLGSTDQVKVTVFGPVVNIAARLEGMTRRFGSAILMDAATAGIARKHFPPTEIQVRPLSRIRPYGMQTAVEVFQLLPVDSSDRGAAEINAQVHQSAIDAFEAGQWAEARRWFEQVADNESARQFFLGFMESHGFQVPSDWNGVITLASK